MTEERTDLDYMLSYVLAIRDLSSARKAVRYLARLVEQHNTAPTPCTDENARTFAGLLVIWGRRNPPVGRLLRRAMGDVN
jgi:hypothetical protein